MEANLTLAIVSAAFGCGLAGLVLWRDRRSVAHLSFAATMILLATEVVLGGLGISASEPEAVLRWLRLRLLLTSLLPGPWLLLSLSYGRGDFKALLTRWWPALIFTAGASILLGSAVFGALAVEVPATGIGTDRLVRLGKAGVVLNGVVLLSCIWALTNLEQTFRSSIGTMRWRIKYMVLGLGMLLVFRVYSSSQAILYSMVNLTLAKAHAVALLVGCILMSVSLARGRLFESEIYPSQQVLYKSLTFVMAGIYLAVVGLLAEVVVLLGVDIGLPAKAFVLLVAVVGLSVLLFSERIRQRLKRFVSRHFRRPFHDYRQVWASFTERTTSLVEEAALCRTAVHWLSETFQGLSVTVWLTNERKDRLLFGASTALSEATGDDRSRARDCSEIIRGLSNLSSPVDFDQLRDPWTQSLKQMNPGFFPEKGGSRVCVPLRARGELLGLAILGDRVSGLPFSSEDLDLLKCVGDQVAGLFMAIQLSKKLLATKEMEAFQAMSAFFVHDLKNTAYTLGLLLENLKRHFEDPSFRADALKTVFKSVEHLNHLIERLTVLRRGLQIEPVAADLNEIATAALDSLMSAGRGSLTRSLGELPNIAVDPDQIQKVLVNLLLNAIDATSAGGEIRLETRQSDGWVVLSVTDTGCGMSPEFMEKSLFRPFQTTKKQGLGIGMFHSKLIVEAHGGRIAVDSQEGKGTTVRVLLPIAKRKP